MWKGKIFFVCGQNILFMTLSKCGKVRNARSILSATYLFQILHPYQMKRQLIWRAKMCDNCGVKNTMKQKSTAKRLVGDGGISLLSLLEKLCFAYTYSSTATLKVKTTVFVTVFTRRARKTNEKLPTGLHRKWYGGKVMFKYIGQSKIFMNVPVSRKCWGDSAKLVSFSDCGVKKPGKHIQE